MSIADDRKLVADADIVSVVTAVRTTVEKTAAGTTTTKIETRVVETFETSATPVSTMHESGYGHGV
jgi:hypothetical protein